ncbi:MAG: hypothetical protein L0Y75_07680 [Acidobacteria bacterium]|nr:hypothetical protein [Acidobacteriota bacterium]
MKRALTVCSVICAVMIGVAAVYAQKGANFAGSWELDKSKSQLPQMQADNIKSATWTVTQDDKQLTREQKIERAEGAGGGPGGGGGRGGGFGMGGGPLTIKLDGSETTTESQRGKTTTKAKWMNEGKTLEISSVTNAEFQGNSFTITTTEHWELADDGKSLKVHRKTETPRGPQESTWVFAKK